MPRRHVVVHGHFYQPPREDPWLELMPREVSAAPDHDWNERITRECYLPLTNGRVRDAHGRLRRVVNVFGRTSFDIGPTLFRWFDQYAPNVAERIVDGDRTAAKALGHGNAIAQPYHHIILPLASRRDKITEVRWGIRDFQKRFGRDPEGMWLPETAVDHETLEVLAAEGIRFTVLSPHQVKAAPQHGRPGRWTSGHHELAIFCYDGGHAHDVAFGDALQDAGRWHERLTSGPLADDGPTVTSLATDGETFGHHHRFGDIALATLLDHLEHDPAVTLTNYSAILAEVPPTEAVTLVERSAWSCPHELGRWMRDCGCRMDGATNQSWRSPLRAGLESLAAAIHTSFEDHWPADAGDPWEVRNAMGPEFEGTEKLPALARRLLEAEHHALAMFTSCAWFFDDLARVEPRIVLRHAMRAIECLPETVRHGALATLRNTLALAESNDLSEGNGVTVWESIGDDEALAVRRLAAGLAAIREVMPDELDQLHFPAHDWELQGDELTVTHRRTGESSTWHAESTILGLVPVRVHLRRTDTTARGAYMVTLEEFPDQVREAFLTSVRMLVAEATLAPEKQLVEPDPASFQHTAFVRALSLIRMDGIESAGVVLHGVLDLLDLEGVPLVDDLQAMALTFLSTLATSTERDGLATRMHLALPDTP